MPIYLFCKHCKTTLPQGSETCKKCGAPIPRTGKKYRVVVISKGKTVTRVAPSLEVARDIEKLINSQLIKDEYVTPMERHKEEERKKREAITIPTLSDVFERYIADYRIAGKAARQIESVWRVHCEKPFGKLLASEISTDMVEAKIHKVRSTGKSPKTAFNILDLISRLYRFAHRLKLYRGENPCESVRKPKINNQTEMFLDEKQIASLLATLDQWHNQTDANMIRFLFFTGCRRGEAFKLEWRDIDLRSRLIKLREPKGGKDVSLPLNQFAVRVLSSQREITGKGPLVFPAEHDGMRIGGSWHKWVQIKKKAGLPDKFRLHDLRHTFASWLANSGQVDMLTLQALLTHKDSRTTQRYSHLFPQSLRKGTSVFDKIIENIISNNNE